MTRNIVALIAFIDSRHAQPHAWGRLANDCAAFALSAVEALTGVRPAPDVTWASRAEARRVIHALGGLEAAFDRVFVRIAPAQAMRGDIGGVADDVFGIHPMIIEGTTLVGPGDSGNRRLPRSALRCAWSAVLPTPSPPAVLPTPAPEAPDHV
jgi:hypothetical protein